MYQSKRGVGSILKTRGEEERKMHHKDTSQLQNATRYSHVGGEEVVLPFHAREGASLS